MRVPSWLTLSKVSGCSSPSSRDRMTTDSCSNVSARPYIASFLYTRPSAVRRRARMSGWSCSSVSPASFSAPRFRSSRAVTVSPRCSDGSETSKSSTRKSDTRVAATACRCASLLGGARRVAFLGESHRLQAHDDRERNQQGRHHHGSRDAPRGSAARTSAVCTPPAGRSPRLHRLVPHR